MRQRVIPRQVPVGQKPFGTNLQDRAFLSRKKGHLNSPAALTSLVAQWSADALSLADSTPVGSWPDSKGARTATQGTAGFKPLFRTNQFGTVPGIQFDAVDDFMSFAAGPGTVNHTVIAIVRSTGAGSRRLLQQSAQNTQFRLDGPGAPALFVQEITAGNATSSALLGNQANPMLVAVTLRLSGMANFYEGSAGVLNSRGNSSWTGVNAFNYDTIGTNLSQVAAQVIGEIDLFNDELSANQIASLYRNYYQPKYGC